MKKTKSSSNNWKNEQIDIFKKYIKNFKPGSIEYMKIDKGIKELEQVGY